MYIIKSTFICEKHVRQKYILSKYVFLLFTYIGYLHTFDALNWVLQNTWAELSKIHTVKSMCFCFLHIPAIYILLAPNPSLKRVTRSSVDYSDRPSSKRQQSVLRSLKIASIYESPTNRYSGFMNKI